MRCFEIGLVEQGGMWSLPKAIELQLGSPEEPQVVSILHFGCCQNEKERPCARFTLLLALLTT